MQFPHTYQVTADAESQAPVALAAAGLETLESAAPAEFGGPGDLWSPETLLVAALADCFILTFKAIARASKFDWQKLSVSASGTLDRVERVIQFTGFTLHAVLDVPEGTDPAKAERLLEKAEQGCLVSASLKATARLTSEIKVPG